MHPRRVESAGVRFFVPAEGQPHFTTVTTCSRWFEHLGFRFEVHANSGDTFAFASQVLGPAVEAGEAPDFTLNLIVINEESPEGRRRIYSHLHAGQFVIHVAPSSAVAVPETRSVTAYLNPQDLQTPFIAGRCLVERAVQHLTLLDRRRYALHAAAVALDDRALALLGESGTGKSTLAYTAARNGFAYLSDDLLSRPIGEGSGRIYGNSNLLYLERDAVERFPELPPPTGRIPELRVHMPDLQPTPALVREATLAGFVVLKRDTKPELRPLAAQTVIDLVRDDVTYQRAVDDPIVADIMRDLTELLTKAPAWELTVGPDPDAAVPLLRSCLAN